MKIGLYFMVLVIMLPAVYVGETWSLTRKEENILRVLEIKLPRRIFSSEK
jgi:hypothetical protein